ncbi:MAG: hypothetical protein HWE37_02205 [Rhodobacteraceae bacterium]|uniref:hypothetical protein n=1 Tax=Salipiger sp. HF18 TaxID=2721557 RepID=UPI00142E651C|nr:hypothetical protein [Salipiger sp. HF18]NIY95257.1 hypothetical protein [Salipiger sp. HF18]NVK58868.1 hypothetical protein [Paracoccaceae bacterium]
MGLKKLAARLAEYRERQEAGRVREIRPEHVERILEKLTRKEASLGEEMAETSDPEKRTRLEQKRKIALEQIARAEWLMAQVDKPAS